ncbi:hypothetical protein EA658_13865 [Pseudoxanthomonas winnipegensis]|uniref:Uncharacterized protein n=1 Tax=Pseudoxanthomonas winnipegensis TaxID=2480810 RepID=A0ABY1WB36_9GAMM|nr:hypothetical protein [Pseudoxanthomonas winnipegensis]TAA18228.1 hypothetical protein EA658_13865 [Pseudoxanthomonas winnipegensis]
MTTALIALLAALRAGQRTQTTAGAYLMFDAAATRALDSAVDELEAAMSAEMARGHLLPSPPPGTLIKGNADLVPLTAEQLRQGRQAAERG